MTVDQRTSSDLRLDPQLHVVFLDGAYHEKGTARVWEELGHLKAREVGEVLERALRRMARYMRIFAAATARSETAASLRSGHASVIVAPSVRGRDRTSRRRKAPR